jgi:hypothetical protein
MKVNYKAGKYKLTKKLYNTAIYGKEAKIEEVFITLTAVQARALFKLYEDLGFSEIEYIGET